MSGRRRALRVFAVALAVSLALHLSLFGLPGWPPIVSVEPTIIEARLEPLPLPVPPTVEPPPLPPRPAPPRRPVRRPSPPPPVLADTPPAQEPVPVSVTAAVPAAADEFAPAMSGPAELRAVDAPLPALAEPLPESEPPPAGPRLEREMPRRGRIVYAFYYGGQRFQVGQSVAEWTVADGRYTLKSETKTSGLAGVLKPLRIVHSSQGTVTAQGLRPDLFSVLREGKDTRLHSARFDWDAMRLRFSGTQDPRATALLPESQDLLSFIHQLSLIRLPADALYLNITNGRKLGTYEVQVLGEETVETPLGKLRAVHLRQVPSRGEESVEVWLCADYGNLPVRVRYTDREGDVAGEQVAQEIWVESG